MASDRRSARHAAHTVVRGALWGLAVVRRGAIRPSGEPQVVPVDTDPEAMVA